MTKIGPGLFRLFLAALVVLNHSTPLRLGSWAVYVFFILSGFWICRMWRERYSLTHQPLVTFIISRWWRLAPVFLICTGLSVFSVFLLHGSSGLHHTNKLGWWLRQLLVVGASGSGTNLPQSWSLDVEMQFYLVAPLLILLIKLLQPFLRYIIAALACGRFILFILLGGDGHLAQLWLFAGFFLIGLILALGEWKPSCSTGFRSLLFFLGVTLLLTLFPDTQRGIWRTGPEPNVMPVALRLWWIIGAAAVVPFLAWHVSQPAPRSDRVLGNLAYSLYLFHSIPGQWYHHFGSPSDSSWKQCALLGANFVAAAAGAIVIFALVDQPSERLRLAWVARRCRRKSLDTDLGQISSKPTAISTVREPV